MISAIGGYFEQADYGCSQEFPIEGVRLNTARNALEYILLQLPRLKHLYLPLYTCEAVIEPLNRLKVAYTLYNINEHFEIADDIQLRDGDYLIANNYFGLKDNYISFLANKYAHRLIVDNAQAFFAPVLSGIKACYSSRKYVGVADGGIAVEVDSAPALKYEVDDTSLHDSHLLIRKLYGAEAGFKDFQANECKLDNQPIRIMSFKTQDLLSHIDYSSIIARRLTNFEFMDRQLRNTNQLEIPDYSSFTCPMVYPYLCEKEGLRSRLIANKIFVARYWPNVLMWAEKESLEYRLATNLLPLPVDQRYGEEDMKRIINIINL